MSRYGVFLEMHHDGTTMAHLLDLPGCTVRAVSRAEALARLPQAIGRHLDWLRRHGEPAPPPGEPIEIALSGESSGYGPFDPGDAAALLPDETAPIAPQEMEPFFRLMACSRADLLDLTQHMPAELLDWRPDNASFHIRRILRHIGNAEEWYVSRIVEPETLPAEWEGDRDMPIFDFLEMERRTALERLCRLSEAERAQVFYPDHWTDHPEEPWTARKVLRRFLEHEREHAGQVREVLAGRRNHLLADLAAARGELLEQTICLAEKDLVQTLVNEAWTVKDALAHIAAWDRWVRREIGRLVAGAEPDAAAVGDINAYNAANVAAWRERPLDEVAAELTAARAEWVAWMRALPEEDFFRPRPRGKADWWLPTWIAVFREHDLEEHAHALAAWKKGRAEARSGPRSILAAALQARRDELLAAAELVPPAERASRPVCGTWTLQNVLGHVADWEAWIVAGLRDMAAGRPPQVPRVTDEEAWNQAHAAARRGQGWEPIWDDFMTTRQELAALLAGMDQDNLGRTFPSVWDRETTPYAWFLVAYAHDREHAQDLRETMAALAGPAAETPGKTYTTRGA